MEDLVKLTGLFSSYVLHEILGPIIAIQNSLDLLNSSNKELANSALQLIRDSSQELTTKIKLYSYIYTLPDNREQVTLEYIKNLSTELFAKTKINLSFINNSKHLHIQAGLAQIIMSLIIICYKNLSRGGTIEIIYQNVNNKIIVVIKAIGEKLRYDITKLRVLQGNDDIESDINSCNEYYISLLNKQMGYNLTITQSENIIEYCYII